jgi:hypothetical protein
MQSLVVALVLTRLDYGNATLAGLADQSLVKLQSVLNAAARLIFLSRKFDHVTPLLRELHWLRFPERINYKLAMLVFKCLNGLAPPYLACKFCRVADTESRQRLRSASTAELIVPRVRRATIGGRAFPIAAAHVWNSLPSSVIDLFYKYAGAQRKHARVHALTATKDHHNLHILSYIVHCLNL